MGRSLYLLLSLVYMAVTMRIEDYLVMLVLLWSLNSPPSSGRKYRSRNIAEKLWLQSCTGESKLMASVPNLRHQYPNRHDCRYDFASSYSPSQI